MLERCKSPGQIDRATATTTDSVSEPKVAGEDPRRTTGSMPLPKQAECLLDMQRLRDVSGDTPEHLREMVDLYLSEARALIPKLGVAVRAGRAEEIERLAHRLFGASANCGMISLVAPLRELERTGRARQLNGAERTVVDDEFVRIEQFLTDLLFEGDESGERSWLAE